MNIMRVCIKKLLLTSLLFFTFYSVDCQISYTPTKDTSILSSEQKLTGTGFRIRWDDLINLIRDSISVDTTFSNTSISASNLTDFLNYKDNGTIELNLSISNVDDRYIELPVGQSGDEITFNIANSSRDADVEIRTLDTIRAGIKVNGLFAIKYFPDEEEKVTFKKIGNYWTANVIRAEKNVLGIDGIYRTRFWPGEVINYRGENYEITSSTYINHNGSSIINDSVFCIPVKAKIQQPLNMLYNSEFITLSVQNDWIWTTSKMSESSFVSDTKDPFGGESAFRIILTTTSTNFRMPVNLPFSVVSGDSVTFSCYVKKKTGSTVNTQVYLRDDLLRSSDSGFWPGTRLISNPADIQDDWKYFEKTIAANLTSSSSQLWIYMAGDIGDTLYFSNMMYNVGNDASQYVPNPDLYLNTGDTLYAVPVNRITDHNVSRFKSTNSERPVFKDGKIKCSLFESLGLSNDDALSEAISACKSAGIGTCSTVQIPDGYVFKRQHVLPEYFTLEGDNKDVTISLDLASTDSVFISAEDTDTDGYYDGHKVMNMNINVLSPINKIIDLKQSLQGKVSYLTINGNDSTNVAINIGKSTGLGSIGTHVKNTFISNCDSAIVYENAGSNHFIEEVTANNNIFGIIGDARQVNINNCDLENNDSVSLRIEGSTTINDTYMEQTLFDFINTNRFTFAQNRFSGPTGGIDVINSSGFIQSNRLYNLFDINKSDWNSNLVMFGNWFQTGENYETINYKYWDDPSFISLFNYSDDGKLQSKNLFPRLRSYEGEITEGLIQNSILSDTIELNNVFLLGREENQILWSDSLGVEGAATNWVIENNIATDPWGNTTADLLRVTAAPGGSSFLKTLVMSDSFNVGETLTVSLYAKRFGQQIPSLQLSLGVGISGPNTGKIGYSDSWQRYEYTIDSVNTHSNQLVMRLAGLTVGDSILFSRLVVNRGPHAMAPVQTTTARINDTTAKLSFGKLVLNGALADSTNSPGLSRQVPVSTVTGWKWENLQPADVSFSALSVATYSDIASISPYLNIGDIVQVRSSGIDYNIQSTEVDYYTTGDSLVIDIGSGLYAVADLSEKRHFETYEDFKKLAPLIGLTGKTEVVTTPYEQFTVSAIPEIIGNADYTDTLVDGYFLDTFNISYPGENILRWSNIPHETGSSTTDKPALYNVGEIMPNFAIGPDGRKNAAAFTLGGTLYLYITNNDTTSAYTFSIWAKMKNGSTGVRLKNLRFASGPAGTNLTIDEPTEWKRYSITLPVATVLNTSYVYMTIENATGDTLLLANAQVEPGGLTDYKETNYMLAPTGNKMYVNRGNSMIKAGVLDISTIAPSDGIYYENTTDRFFLQDAINFCKQGSRCNEILLGKNVYYLDSTLYMTDHVRLVGGTDTHGETGNPDLMSTGGASFRTTDDFKGTSLFDFIKESGSQTIAGTGLENIRIQLRDTVGTVIYCNEIQHSEFKNILVETDGVLGQFGVGLDLKTDPSSDQNHNLFSNIELLSATDAGVVYEGSTSNYFREIDVTGSKVGFRMKGGNKCEIQGLLAQNNDTSVVIWDGHLSISGLYTEGSGNSGGSIIKMLGGKLKIENSTLQVDDVLADTLLNLVAGDWLSIENTEIRSDGAVLIGSDFGGLNLSNLSLRTPIERKLQSQDEKSKIKSINTFSDVTSEKFEDVFNEVTSLNSFITGSVFAQSYITDTVFLSSPLLTGHNRNYISYSDSLIAPAFVATPDTVFIHQNNFTAPDGSNTATTFVFTGTDISGSTISLGSHAMLDSFNVGDEFVFSCYVYPHFDHPFNLFTVRPYGLSNNGQGFPEQYLPQNQWSRTYITGKIVDNTSGSNTISLRLTSPSAATVLNDSLSVWGMQIEKGTYPTTYTPTSTVGISNEDINLNLNSSLNINGNTQVNGNLTVSGSFSVLDDVIAEVSAADTAVLYSILPVNTSSSALEIEVPSSPSVGDWFIVSDSRGQAAARNITIDFVSTGENLHSASQNYIINSQYGFVRFTYVDGTVGWIITGEKQ